MLCDFIFIIALGALYPSLLVRKWWNYIHVCALKLPWWKSKKFFFLFQISVLFNINLFSSVCLAPAVKFVCNWSYNDCWRDIKNKLNLSQTKKWSLGKNKFFIRKWNGVWEVSVGNLSHNWIVIKEIVVAELSFCFYDMEYSFLWNTLSLAFNFALYVNKCLCLDCGGNFKVNKP